MSAPSTIKFAQVLGRLLDQRYKRNRAALASAAHVSPSALSQYVRGRATPSLAVLVDLARALEVSLDYLVYGQDSAQRSEDVLWAQHLDDTVRRMTAEGASLRQLVDRMGINLSDRIHEVATEAVKQAGARGGALSLSELAQIERYSYSTRIATVDLDTDVLLPGETSSDAVAAPGSFSDITAENISAGNDYVYIIPDSERWITRARLIVQKVKTAIEAQVGSSTSDVAVATHLQFYVTIDGLVPGYVIYNLDRVRMAAEKPLLYDLVEGFLGAENEISGPSQDSGDFLALVVPPNPGFDVYPLISSESLPTVARSFENLRKRSDRLSFIDIPAPRKDRV
jgi:DNA-binding XRE family transcriptional regulator